MKKYGGRLCTMAAIAVVLSLPLFAQDKSDDNNEQKLKDEVRQEKIDDGDAIIIRRKDQKDVKVTVEIKNNQVFVNGKPITDYEDDAVSIKKMTRPFIMDDNYALIAPKSPFRAPGWSYGGDNVFYDNENGKQAFLGVTWNTEEKGARITQITKESAAEKAGLKLGDIITKIGDTKIEDGDLADAVHKYKPEDKVTVTYLRDGKEQKTTVTMGRMKQVKVRNFTMKMPRMNQNFNFNGDNDVLAFIGRPRLGIKAQDLEEGKGAKVLDVDDDSPADKAGIKEGDVITEFDGKTVENADDLARLAHEGKGKYIYKVKFTRDGKTQEIDVKIPRNLKTADL
ncbi:MAG TPA: PDZ domain-containing protein [Puia sp.]|nr:PDZ domain-containing protein [Puia sp.]